MRSLVHNASISTVNQASRTLRNLLRPGQRNTFLAVCWLMVLAPFTFLPGSFSQSRSANSRQENPGSFMPSERLICSVEKPLCVMKRWSSLLITANGIARAISSSERLARWKVSSSMLCSIIT